MSAVAAALGVIYVARGGRVLTVDCFDGDSGLLPAGFRWSTPGGASAGADGLAVDGDRRLWIADRRRGEVRAFHLFGAQTHQLSSPAGPGLDRAAHFGHPSALAAEGTSDDLRLLVGSAGERRHGAQVFGPGGELLRSLQPNGDPHGRFRGVASVSLAGRFAFAGEPRGRVHIWRDLEFLQVVELARDRFFTRRSHLVAIAGFSDGSFWAAVRGAESAVLAYDAGGGFRRVLLGGAELEDPVGLVRWDPPRGGPCGAVLLDQGGARICVLDPSGGLCARASALP